MFPFRSVVLGALIPAFIHAIGVGAMVPVIAPSATSLGASLAAAGFIAALLHIGQILADLPAGAFAARVGDRRAMLVAAVVAGLGFAGAALSPGLITLGLAILLIGAASAVFHLARHSYLTEITPPLQRARVMSTLGGVHRIGQFLGPFLGALVIYSGEVHAVYLLGTLTSVAAAATVLLSREEKRSPAVTDGVGTGEATPLAPEPSLLALARNYRSMLSTLGVGVLLIGAIRGARETAIPLWGEYLGLDPAVTSLIYGLAGGVDMLLFYPAGKLMDRMGRLWVGVPGTCVMGAALLAMPFTVGPASLAAVAAVLGFGNGMTAGILMTLGSDVAPAAGRARFLGMWRVLTDTGAAGGPLVVSAGAALGSLAAGIWAAGVLGPAAGGALARWLPRWSVHANRTTRRRAGL
ncbi:putative MFS family arabinose efflux permease [Bogoriella caseilytica]|uniref:Putative MFS family arabinose efflux permease n=2 Tax=Bogoriella caseilytica TaxID=56055 RepID=A0A3N2BAR2_9MICO|nr:putative MFS family arabinose efflux permease [Bogoriella caseilytica]